MLCTLPYISYIVKLKYLKIHNVYRNTNYPKYNLLRWTLWICHLVYSCSEKPVQNVMIHLLSMKVFTVNDLFFPVIFFLLFSDLSAHLMFCSFAVFFKSSWYSDYASPFILFISKQVCFQYRVRYSGFSIDKDSKLLQFN